MAKAGASQWVAEAVAGFERELRAQVADGAPPRDPAAVGAAAADWAARAARFRSGVSKVAERIGPVYTTGDLTRWLVAPGAGSLTTEAVRKRAKERRLVAFLTDDNQWAFPEWQFEPVAGRLVPVDAVVGLWQRLPHGGFLTDADLAAWMHTGLRSLGGATPASHAASVGVDTALTAALTRLRARVTGR